MSGDWCTGLWALMAVMLRITHVYSSYLYLPSPPVLTKDIPIFALLLGN